MSEQPAADHVTAEDDQYAAIGSTVRGLRRTGSTFMEACVTAAAYWAAVHMANASSAPDGS